MKKIVALYFLACLQLACTSIYAQVESLKPVGINKDLFQGPRVSSLTAGKAIDSTFIYFSDTLTVPFFDDFSRNHFQQYNPDFNSSATSSQLFHYLTQMDGTPLPASSVYSTEKTYVVEKNVGLDTTIYIEQTPISIRVGNLNAYPVLYQTVSVYPAYSIQLEINPPNQPDTIPALVSLIHQDSARQFFHQLKDKNAYWLDQYAYHNYTMAKKPWTIGVVTFDGLDENGYPYAINTSTSGVADYLTSKKIDLAAFGAQDSIYFSFIYQNKGFGDQPEAMDSLVLDFYAPDVDQWYRMWGAAGEVKEDFIKVHFKVTQNQFFKSDFQFRFKNYGGLSGSLDHFHLDYVMLRPYSGYQDTLFKDFAFVYPVNTLLKDYTAVPWEHYKADPLNKMSQTGELTVRNGSNVPENNQNGDLSIYYQNQLQHSYTLLGQTLSGGNINYAPRTTYTSLHDFSAYRFDENITDDLVKFDLVASASSQFNNPQINDTTFGQQVFSNYYSYDDGSAEQVYEINGAQYRLAYQFTPYKADSLIGIQFNFVPSVVDLSNKIFMLCVWDDNNGKPGQILYEDDYSSFRTPNYEYGLNTFAHYYFKDTAKIFVDGTFYVGWRQIDEKISVGFDCNTVSNSKLFYSANGGSTWTNSSIAGSVMIRPVFSTPLDYLLGVEPNIPTLSDQSFEVFPNPVLDQLNILYDGTADRDFYLYDMRGTLLRVLEKNTTQINLSDLNAGIYLLKEANTGFIQKIIKQ